MKRIFSSSVPFGLTPDVTVQALDNSEVQGKLLALSGRNLTAVLSGPVAVNASARIELPDALLLAKVTSTHFESRWEIAMEVQHAVPRLPGVAQLLQKVGEAGNSTKPGIHEGAVEENAELVHVRMKIQQPLQQRAFHA